MTDFIFCTEKNIFDRDSDGLISRSFFSEFISEEILEGLTAESSLWIVAKRSQAYFIQSKLQPDLIQQYTHGKMSGWYFISCSPKKWGHISPPTSLRVESPLLASRFKPPLLNSFEPLGSDDSSYFEHSYVSSRRRTNLLIDTDVKRRLLFKYIKENANDLIQMNSDAIESEIRLRFYEDDLYLNAKLPDISDPFISTAIEIWGFLNQVELKNIDIKATQQVAIPPIFAQRTYAIDCKLRPLTEDDLAAREMIWNPNNFGEEKAKNGLMKTNLAEKRHQEMLRQLNDYFKTLGYLALGSSSIDLAIECDNHIFLFEIKSSTIDNYKDQALKACGQLAEYSYNLSLGTVKNIYKIIIIEIPQNGLVDFEYVSAICKSINITLIGFSFLIDWPQRCLIPESIMHLLDTKRPPIQHVH